MVLTSRKSLVILLLWGCGSILFLGIWGYIILGGLAGSAAPADGAAGSARFMGEWLLYACIVCATVFLILFFRLFIRSRNVMRELDKLIEFSKSSGIPSGAGLRKLGKVGEKISRLYAQINMLNDKRGLRISALSNLIDLLTGNMEISILVTDVTGMIIHATKEYLEKQHLTRADCIGASIEEMVSEIIVPEVIFEIEKRHAFVEKTVPKGTVICYPVYDRDRNISFLLFLFEKRPFLLIGESRQRLETAGGEPKKSLFQRFLAGTVGRRKGGAADEGQKKQSGKEEKAGNKQSQAETDRSSSGNSPSA